MAAKKNGKRRQESTKKNRVRAEKPEALVDDAPTDPGKVFVGSIPAAEREFQAALRIAELSRY